MEGPDGIYRECSVCGQFLPIDEFPRSRQGSHGRSYRCRDCESRRNKRQRVDRLRQLAVDPNDPRHGTSSAWQAGCRCGSCVDAMGEYIKKRHERPPETV